MTTYRVLGPLEPGVTAGRDRIVLAMMLLHPDRVVSVSELVDAVWAEDPPSTARAQLQACVSRLRRALPSGVIDTDPAGYRLRIAADELDSLVFAKLIEQARAEGDAALFREALDLWRGEALVGIDSRPVRAAAAALDEQYAATVEEWAELELAAGGERDLLGPLGAVVERFPLRERLRGRLIAALAAAGRTADALAEYRRAERVLRDELGIEPGRELQELHRRVLAGEERSGGRVRCLPRTVGDFTGRDEVVGRLLAGLDRTDPAIAVIDGMPGCGKTTLALHVASLVVDRYPDAHLYVNLHGPDAERPVEPAAALLILLRQLGIPAKAVPDDPDGRVALWRTELARRRVLVVLDNAHSSAQLADLLPTVPGSLALVTSRRRLAGLDDVHLESLPVLPAADALALLARIAGDRIGAEPEAAAEVVRRCGGLPLALRLAGARLAHRPRWRVADLVRRLGASALPGLSAEDRSVASAFALSYGQLPDPAKRVFRLLGLHPGTVFDALDVAALSGLPLDETRDAVDDLIDVHLVEEHEADVFRLHDLLREYAAALAADLPPDERHRALGEVLDLQMHACAATTVGIPRATLDRHLGAPEPHRPDLLAAVADPLARLERERPQLAAYIDAAAAAGFADYAWRIPRAAWYQLFTRGYEQDVRALLARALAIVEENGDRATAALVINYLASGYTRNVEFARALELLDRSLRLHQELGDLRGAATVLGNRAGIYAMTGRFAECVESARQAERLRLLTGDPNWSRVTLHNMAVGCAGLGRHAEALRIRRRSLLCAIESDDDSAVGVAFLYIQREKLALGRSDPETARRYLAAALRLSVRSGHRTIEGDVLNEQGRLMRRQGRLAEAIALHERALEVARETGDQEYEAIFLNDLGATRCAAGDLAGGLELHRRALAIAEPVGMRHIAEEARAAIAGCGRDGYAEAG